MALSRQLMGTAQQMLGRAPTAQEMQDPEFMSRLVAAADQGNAQDAGVRDNMSWVDEQMAPAPGPIAKQPVQNASMQQSRASSGKGDRLDAQQAPLPPRRPAEISGEGVNQQAPLPPRRPTEFGGREESAAQSANGDDAGVKSLARGMAAQRNNISPDATPAMRTPEAAGRVAVDEGMDEDVQGAINSYNETHPVDDYFGPNTGSNTNYREEVSGVQGDMRKLADAGIDPASLTTGQRIRMQTMGIDRWIAEQTDQRGRDSNRRMARAVDKSGR